MSDTKIVVSEPTANRVLFDEDGGGVGGAPLAKTGGTPAAVPEQPAVASGIPAMNVENKGGAPLMLAGGGLGGAPAAVAFNDPGKTGGVALATRRFSDTANA